MRSISADGYVEEWFGEAFARLAEGYPLVKIRAGTTKMYAQRLSDLEPEQVLRAFARAVDESEFFPSVAKIRSFIVPSADEAGVLAWAGLIDAARTVGAWQSLEIEDTYCAEALRRACGSWAAFCALEGPAQALARQAFLAAYKDARRSGTTSREPVRFAGLAEAGGTYQRIPASWSARLGLDGRTASERERPALEGGKAIKRLTIGDDDGEKAEAE